LFNIKLFNEIYYIVSINCEKCTNLHVHAYRIRRSQTKLIETATFLIMKLC